MWHVLTAVNDHSDNVPTFVNYHLRVMGGVLEFSLMLLKNAADHFFQNR